MEKLSMSALLAMIVLLLLPGCDDENKNELLPPDAAFEVSDDQIYIWETVKFSDVSRNEPSEWEWYFEGGEPEVSVEPGPEVLYSEAGTYSVKLTVRNEYGESVKEVDNFIEVSEYQNYFGTLTDERDGQEYKTIMIGNTYIMAENLRYMTGDAVYYDNDPENGEVYGMLYKWETALDACPAGWRLPTRNEYDFIREYLGGEYVAGGKLKTSGTEYWLSPNEYGTNETGFSAVGAGGYMPGHLEFFGLNENTTYWTQTEAPNDLVWSMALSNTNGRMAIQNTTSRQSTYFSARCIKD
jgi:uncharacterized protein (TIGR02145 family)